MCNQLSEKPMLQLQQVMAEFNHVLQDQPGLIVIRGDRGNAKTLNYHLVNADAYEPCTEGSKGV